MRLIELAAVATFALPATVLAQVGYAHGADHCYYFAAPHAWSMDNRSAAADGVPMVFYPAGTTWQSAEVVMYTRPSASAQAARDPVRAQVDDVLAMYRGAGESLAARQIETLKATAGAVGALWSFSGYGNGGSEYVVYFRGSKTVNYFVAQAPKNADAERAKASLRELAMSYREAADCRPCAGGSACTTER